MIARHALFSVWSIMSACEDLGHTGATYSTIPYNRASAVALVVLVFVPHFEIDNFFRGLLR